MELILLGIDWDELQGLYTVSQCSYCMHLKSFLLNAAPDLAFCFKAVSWLLWSMGVLISYCRWWWTIPPLFAFRLLFLISYGLFSGVWSMMSLIVCIRLFPEIYSVSALVCCSGLTNQLGPQWSCSSLYAPCRDICEWFQKIGPGK